MSKCDFTAYRKGKGRMLFVERTGTRYLITKKGKKYLCKGRRYSARSFTDALFKCEA